jgi:hypothetical protein
MNVPPVSLISPSLVRVHDGCAARSTDAVPRRHGEETHRDDLHDHSGHGAERRGDAAIVESITKPGAEIHGYEPTPQDIVKAQHADLVLWNGLNLERWFERFSAT